MPGFVHARVVLGASPTARLGLRGVWCWPTGLGFDVVSAVRSSELLVPLFKHGRDKHGPTLEVAVGDVVVSTARWREPADMSLFPGGGRGGLDYFEQLVNLWPLPPPEPLRITVDWVDAEIERTTTTLDGRLFTEAAASATPLWEP